MTGPVQPQQTSGVHEAQLQEMARAGQRLAVHWGHEPWSDSWARLVAETMLGAGAQHPERPYCPMCGRDAADPEGTPGCAPCGRRLAQ